MTKRFRVILVEPEYEINVGSVARVMKNFGFAELFLVRPKCNHLGFDAIKFSKHAKEILENAQISESLLEASKGCKFLVGTTGVLHRHWTRTIRSPVPIKQFAKMVQHLKEGRVAVAFGNEGAGLCEEDVSSCDFLTTIPANADYPVLNLSHAVAIILYELSKHNEATFVPAGEKEKEQLINTFGLYVDRYAQVMRNPRKAKIAFRRVIGKSLITDKECASILGVLRRAYNELPQNEERKKNRCSKIENKKQKD
ncbi:MAG: RNA methyltransferase [Candidatus Anstonellaceae archaeon]